MILNHYKTAFEDVENQLQTWDKEYEEGTFSSPKEALWAFAQLLRDVKEKHKLNSFLP